MKAFAIKVTRKDGSTTWANASGSFGGAEWNGFAMHASREMAQHWADMLVLSGLTAEVVELTEHNQDATDSGANHD